MASTLAGRKLGPLDPRANNGIAHEARIALFDFGDPTRFTTMVPPSVKTIFYPPAYALGACAQGVRAVNLKFSVSRCPRA